MTLAEFVRETFIIKYDSVFRPRIICNDGFSMSVQGSRAMYCTPRENSPVYTAMEIGYPSSKEESIMEYAETPEEPTSTVYARVPVDIIQEIINKHQGINSVETFKKQEL